MNVLNYLLTCILLRPRRTIPLFRLGRWKVLQQQQHGTTTVIFGQIKIAEQSFRAYLSFSKLVEVFDGLRLEGY